MKSLLYRRKLLLGFGITLAAIGTFTYLRKEPTLAEAAGTTLSYLENGRLADAQGLYIAGKPVGKELAACLDSNVIRPHLINFRFGPIHTEGQDGGGAALTTLTDESGRTQSLTLNSSRTPDGFRVNLDTLLYKLWALDASLSFYESPGEDVAAALADGLRKDRPRLESCGLTGLTTHGKYRTWNQLLREFDSVNVAPGTNVDYGQ